MGGDSAYSVGYGFDEVGRFGAVVATNNGALIANVQYGYVPNSGLLSGWTNSVAGTSVSRSYEANRDLLTQVRNLGGQTVISQFDYQNDALGRRTQRLDTLAAYPLPLTNSFGYNPRSELTAALMGTNEFGYAYDPIGNRQVATNNAEVLSYLANEMNQYTNIADGVTLTPTYDMDGNMTGYGDWAFGWNGENRLILASNATAVASYKYDFMSRRYQKVVGSTTNTFLYDGWNLVQEISQTPTPPYAVTNSYIWGPDLSGSMQGAGGIGGLLSVTRSTSSGTATYYPLADGNGNITDYVDTNGTVVAHREFDPYGNTTVATGPMVNQFNFWFSSKYLDHETGMYYYGFRFYSSELGRWLSRDPIEEAGGLGLYSFCEGGPIDAVDSLGMTGGLVYYMNPRTRSNPDLRDGTEGAWMSLLRARYATIGTIAYAMSGLGTYLDNLLNVMDDVTVRYVAEGSERGSSFQHLSGVVWLADRNDALHELAHVLHYQRSPLTYFNPRYAEGVAYLSTHFVDAIRKLANIELDVLGVESCCDLEGQARVWWQQAWDKIDLDGVDGGSYTGVFGISHDFAFEDVDARRLSSHFGLDISCRWVATYYNRRLREKGCCYRFSCYPGHVGAVHRMLAPNLPIPDVYR